MFISVFISSSTLTSITILASRHTYVTIGDNGMIYMIYTGGQKESVVLRFMFLSAYIGRQEAHRTPTAFRVIAMNVLDRLRCVP